MAWQIFGSITKGTLIPATSTQVAPTHYMPVYLRPQDKSSTRGDSQHDFVWGLGQKLETLKHLQYHNADAVAQQLSRTKSWLQETQKNNPNAIVYAREKTVKDRKGNTGTAIVLYTRSKPGNLLSRWIDSTFYGKDKQLAAEVLSHMESHFSKEDIQKQGAHSPSILPARAHADAKGLTIGNFSNKIDQFEKIAISQAAARREELKQADFEESIFDWESAFRKRMHAEYFMSTPLSESIFSKFLLHDPNEIVDSLVQNHGFQEPEVRAFSNFMKQVESDTSNQPADRKGVLKFAKIWAEKYNDEDQSFREFVKSKPALASWNTLALALADRDKYFDTMYNNASKKYEFKSNKELDALISVGNASYFEIMCQLENKLKAEGMMPSNVIGNITETVIKLAEAIPDTIERMGDTLTNTAEKAGNLLTDTTEKASAAIKEFTEHGQELLNSIDKPYTDKVNFRTLENGKVREVNSSDFHALSIEYDKETAKPTDEKEATSKPTPLDRVISFATDIVEKSVFGSEAHNGSTPAEQANSDTPASKGDNQSSESIASLHTPLPPKGVQLKGEEPTPLDRVISFVTDIAEKSVFGSEAHNGSTPAEQANSDTPASKGDNQSSESIASLHTPLPPTMPPQRHAAQRGRNEIDPVKNQN